MYAFLISSMRATCTTLNPESPTVLETVRKHEWYRRGSKPWIEHNTCDGNVLFQTNFRN
jgi:hypothetical protein